MSISSQNTLGVTDPPYCPPYIIALRTRHDTFVSDFVIPNKERKDSIDCRGALDSLDFSVVEPKHTFLLLLVVIRVRLSIE